MQEDSKGFFEDGTIELDLDFRFRFWLMFYLMWSTAIITEHLCPATGD